MIVKIPATSANIGCGYDTVGLALELFNEFHIEHAPSDELTGFSGDLSRHMVFGTRDAACAMLGLEKKPFRLTVKAEVPMASGLGSSSTCVLAGIMAALYVNDQPQDRQTILDIATRMEGHPDNVVPAYLGGLVAAIIGGGKVISRKFIVNEDIRFLTVIPPFEFATAYARAAIPELIPHKDAVANLGRVVLLTDALERGDLSNLKELLKDELHEKYRLPLIFQLDPNYRTLHEFCREHSAGTFLSGAGPTFISILHEADAQRLRFELKEKAPGYRIIILKSRNDGIRIVDERSPGAEVSGRVI